jgi:DNA-binding MarR family transcriptional regulator
VVTRLEARGWVRREVCPTDGRCTNAVLTRDGRDRLAAAAPGHAAAVRDLVLDALTAAQVRHLRDIGRRILRRIDPDEPCLNGTAHRTADGARRVRSQLRVEVET